jgi:hypothetical protein
MASSAILLVRLKQELEAIAVSAGLAASEYPKLRSHLPI